MQLLLNSGLTFGSTLSLWPVDHWRAAASSLLGGTRVEGRGGERRGGEGRGGEGRGGEGRGGEGRGGEGRGGEGSKGEGIMNICMSK